jgi:hypothetical protein
MGQPDNFEIICKNLYHDAKHIIDKDHLVKTTMEIREFQKLAKYMNIRLFTKLLRGTINFQEFKSEIYKDKDTLKKLCLDNLKAKFDPKLFEDNHGMKELIDYICRYRVTNDRLDVLLNDPLLQIDMR